jgi:16S rRNA processing protein RimM
LSNKEADNNLILLGKITATHGIHGQLKVVLYSGEASTLPVLESVILKDSSDRPETFDIEKASVNGKRALISLKNFSDINQVLRFVGRELFALREQLPETSADEYYWHDLIGIKVFTTEGRELGRLDSIMETGSNDVYVIVSNGREYLLPAIEDVVVSVNLESGVMTVNPGEWLSDL